MARTSALRAHGLAWLLAGAGFAAVNVQAAVATAATPRVMIETGQLEGSLSGDVAAFKGVPFAAPPVGVLRWKAPQAAAAWRGLRKAASYGSDCMQEPFPGDAAPLGVAPSEDCLYTNLWAPASIRRGQKLPVMVWIYGGGFVNGGASPAVYDGAEFAKRGVVLVSFNYRLGHFGFFAHPALSAEQAGAPLANYALMDQIAALEWVKRNIAAFGGDASNVTIFGESAGGMSVHVLLTTPLARGLFHKAIIQSGGGRAGIRDRALSGGPESAEGRGLAFAEKYGIRGEDAAALAKLRDIPAAQIAKGMHMGTMSSDPTYVGGPVQDGRIVLGSPAQLYAEGKGANVPVIVGATNSDIGFAAGHTLDELFAAFGPNQSLARALYNPDNSTNLRQVASRVGGDQTMVEPARQVARVLAARGQSVYQFRFSYVAESMRGQWPGAPHATDIPYVFNTVAARYGKDLKPADSKLAVAAIDYWTSFAKTGVPSAAGAPAWPRYDAAADVILDFSNAGPVVVPDPWKLRLDLAERQQPLPGAAATGPTSRRPPLRTPNDTLVSPELLADGKLALRLYAPAARGVSVDGDFLPFGAQLALARDPDGVWQATAAVKPGTYRYQFFVDGVATQDPKNTETSRSNAVTRSLVHIAGPGSEFEDLRDVPHGALAEVYYPSKAFRSPRRLHIYTPPGYAAGKGDFPVLYLLHGAGDADDSWDSVGRAGFILDNLIAVGRARPMIIVMPAGHVPPGEARAEGAAGAVRAMGVDAAADPFTADVVENILPFVEANYRVSKRPQDRAIAGLSMGGVQAANIGFANLDKFKAIGIFSSGWSPDSRQELAQERSADFTRAAKDKPLLWVACGRDDFIRPNMLATLESFDHFGIPYTRRDSDGGHTWENWRAYLNEFAPLLFRP